MNLGQNSSMLSLNDELAMRDSKLQNSNRARISNNISSLQSIVDLLLVESPKSTNRTSLFKEANMLRFQSSNNEDSRVGNSGPRANKLFSLLSLVGQSKVVSEADVSSLKLIYFDQALVDRLLDLCAYFSSDEDG